MEKKEFKELSWKEFNALSSDQQLEYCIEEMQYLEQIEGILPIECTKCFTFCDGDCSF